MQVVLRATGPALRQPTFKSKVHDKYNELNNFKTEVRNIFLMNNHNIEESEKVPIIMNWLGCAGLRVVHALTDSEQEKCKTSSGLFVILIDVFKPLCND